MSTTSRVVRAGLAVVAISGAPIGIAIASLALGSSRANACSIGSFGSPEAQRAAMLEALEGSDLVVVGGVLDERSLGTLTNGQGQNDVYESSVRVDAVLAGESPGDIVLVGQLAYDDTFCSGGPRLREGETVLVSLDRGFIKADGESADMNVWRIHHFLGKVLFDANEAVSQYASLGIEVGNPDSLIQAYAQTLGSSPGQVELAIAALTEAQPTSGDSGEGGTAGGDSAEREGGSRPSWLVVAGVVAALLVASTFYLVRRRSLRS